MITAQLLRSWSACWDDDKIAAFGRTEMTPREVAADERISLNDRLWVVCEALWYLDERAARYFAIETALTVAHLAGDEDDQAQFLGLMNELMCIEDLPVAQRDAARDAARAAARDAARAAARDAAWDAARDAVWDAARDAARDAVWAAVWAADIKKSIARAIEWLGPYADGWEEDEAEETARAA